MDPPENRNYICISLDQYPAVTSRIDTARFAISWKLVVESGRIWELTRTVFCSYSRKDTAGFSISWKFVVDPAENRNSLDQYSVIIRRKIPRGSLFRGNLCSTS